YHFVVWDQLRLTDRQLRLTGLELSWLQLFDGRRTLRDIQTEAMRRVGGQLLPVEVFARLAERLAGALFLEGPSYRARVDSPVRAPACIPSYGSDPEALRRTITRLFAGPGGPGLPGEPRPDDRFRGALVPHIDS